MIWETIYELPKIILEFMDYGSFFFLKVLKFIRLFLWGKTRSKVIALCTRVIDHEENTKFLRRRKWHEVSISYFFCWMCNFPIYAFRLFLIPSAILRLHGHICTGKSFLCVEKGTSQVNSYWKTAFLLLYVFTFQMHK